MLNQLRELLVQTVVSEETNQQALPEPKNEKSGEHMQVFTPGDKAKQNVDNLRRCHTESCGAPWNAA
jgi:hypothetical protein